MGVWILDGKIEGNAGAVMVDSVTLTAFGPVFDGYDEAEDFLDLCKTRFGADPRTMTDLAMRKVLEEVRSV